MTPEERREAAEVMVSEGPWELMLRDHGTGWRPCDIPSWDWDSYIFRVKLMPYVRYLNIFKSGPRIFCGSLKDTRALADSDVVNTRIACVRVEFVDGKFDD